MTSVNMPSVCSENVSFHPGYNAPYLSVYSENAIDVFDVNNMEWIQTIPLKKVSAAALSGSLCWTTSVNHTLNSLTR